MSLQRVVPPLPDGATMALWPLASLYQGPGSVIGAPLYVSRGKWLYPLFELLDAIGPGSPAGVIAAQNLREMIDAGAEVFLRDRVIGRGAAFLILRAGIRDAWADVVSDGALAVFAAQGADLGGGERVPAIACMTEDLLRDVDDPDMAWTLLSARRRESAAEAAMRRPR